MIEPSGQPIDVLGVPNRQSKVPMGQTTARQAHPESAPNDQAQDEPGFGSVGTAGIGEASQGHGFVADCASPAQNAGSKASRVPAPLSPLNLGTPGWEGARPTDVVGGEDAGTNSRSVDGASDPQGKKVLGRGDIGVAPGMLFPGIVE